MPCNSGDFPSVALKVSCVLSTWTEGFPSDRASAHCIQKKLPCSFSMKEMEENGRKTTASRCFEWSSFCMAGSGILIGTFSLSGSSAKKVTTVRSSLALLVNFSCKIYCFCKYSYLLS